MVLQDCRVRLTWECVMHWFSQRSFLQSKTIYSGLALGMISVLLAGCGGGGSGSGATGPNPVVPGIDLHADTTSFATRIFPDNGFIIGAINVGADVDFFQFNCTAGVAYTFQVETDGGGRLGAPAPIDMNEDRDLILFVVDLNGATTLATTANSAGALSYDIDPAGFGSAGDELGWRGDSRITFTPEVTGRYFLRVSHFRPLVGTGNYVLTLSSSQLGSAVSPTIESDVLVNAGHHGSRFIVATDDEGVVLFDDFARGILGPMFWNAATREFRFSFNANDPVFFGDNEDPETRAAHLHFGHPNIIPNWPQLSQNFSEGAADDPHPVALDISEVFARRSARGESFSFESELMQGGAVYAVIPVTAERSAGAATGQDSYEVTLHFGEAYGRGIGGNDFDIPAGAIRLLSGFPWYIDLHITDDLDTVPGPYVVSHPFGDVYGVFETELILSPFNLVRSSSYEDRGFLFNTEMSIFVDNALQTFQILNEELYLTERRIDFILDPNNPMSAILPIHEVEDANTEGTPLEPVNNLYAQQLVGVHRGGIGQTGSQILDLGRMPSRDAMAILPSDQTEQRGVAFQTSPGLRTLVHRMTTAEMQSLRQAFYTGGWYVQVSNNAGTPLARGEGSFWEIQTDPNDAFPNPIRNGETGYEFGYANFVSDYADGGAITVVANGKIVGVLDQAVTDESMPACDEESISGLVASGRYIPQTYPYRAFADDGTEWTGTFTVENGGCNTVVLSAPTAE